MPRFGLDLALSSMMEGPSVAAAVLIIAEYQYKSAFVVDQEINAYSCLIQLSDITKN